MRKFSYIGGGGGGMATLLEKILLPYRVDPFSKGRETIMKELPLFKVHQFPLKYTL